MAHLFEGEGEGGDFDEAGDVAARAHEKFDVRQAHAEDFIVIFFQAGALLNRLRGPLPQGDDHIDAFLHTDAFDAEHFANVDDADPSTLHVTAVEWAGRRHEFAFVEEFGDGEIIGHERMAPFDEGEGALGFADAGIAAEHHADALDIEGRGVFGAAGSELIVDTDRGEIHKIHCDHRCPEKGQAHLGRYGEQRMGGDVVTCQHETWNAAFHHPFENPNLLALRERLQVGHLGSTEHLDTAVSEVFKKTSQGEGWAVDAALVDEAVQAGAAGDRFQQELLTIGFEEMRDGDAVNGFLHGGKGALRAERLNPEESN